MKKRFIAGAVCPKCNSKDTLSLTKDLGIEKVTCVDCGMEMTQPDQHVETKVRSTEQVLGVFKP